MFSLYHLNPVTSYVLKHPNLSPQVRLEMALAHDLRVIQAAEQVDALWVADLELQRLWIHIDMFESGCAHYVDGFYADAVQECQDIRDERGVSMVDVAINQG